MGVHWKIRLLGGGCLEKPIYRGDCLKKRGWDNLLIWGGGGVWGGVDIPMPTMTLLPLRFREMQDWRIGDHIKEENVITLYKSNKPTLPRSLLLSKYHKMIPFWFWEMQDSESGGHVKKKTCVNAISIFFILALNKSFTGK